MTESRIVAWLKQAIAYASQEIYAGIRRGEADARDAAFKTIRGLAERKITISQADFATKSDDWLGGFEAGVKVATKQSEGERP